MNAPAIANKVLCRHRARLRWPEKMRPHQLLDRRIHLQPSPECFHTVLQQRLKPEQVCCLQHLSLQHLSSLRFLPISFRFYPISPGTLTVLALAPLALSLATSSSPIATRAHPPPPSCTSPSLPTLRQLSHVQVPQHHPERPCAHLLDLLHSTLRSPPLHSSNILP
jgi:hypothetical protein